MKNIGKVPKYLQYARDLSAVRVWVYGEHYTIGFAVSFATVKILIVEN